MSQKRGACPLNIDPDGSFYPHCPSHKHSDVQLRFDFLHLHLVEQPFLQEQ